MPERRGLAPSPARPSGVRARGERREGVVLGPVRALAATYAVFALAAGSRAAVQLAVDPGRAPVAYALSALAALVYLVGAMAFRRPGPAARRTAGAVCRFELAGVLAVGTSTVVLPDLFPDQTVWSGYGEGYGWLPLLLPVVGLLALRRRAATGRSAPWRP